MRCRRKREAGFTLIEMIVVIAVLALAAGLVLARGPMRSRTVDLRAAAREMAAEMRGARARAIDEDRVLVFELDAVHADYGVRNDRRHSLPAGVSVVSRDAAPTRSVVFRPDGSSSGGAMVLAEGDQRIEIDTDWLTGGVSIR